MRKKNNNRRKDLEAQRAKIRFANSAVHRLTNLSMANGKKGTVSKALCKSITACKSKIFDARVKIRRDLLAAKQSEREKLLQSGQISAQTVYNVEPIVETRKVRVRGSTYQVPFISHKGRRERIAVDCILNVTKGKKRSSQFTLSSCLGQELFDSLEKASSSIIRRNQTHKLASQSRVYARYRWW